MTSPFRQRIALVILCILGSTLIMSAQAQPDVIGAANEIVYRGVSEVTLSTLDLNGNVVGQQTFAINTEFIIKAPISYGGLTETNPFNMAISARVAELGSYFITSANVVTAPSGNFLAQHWAYSETDTNLFTGELVNDTLDVNYITGLQEIYPGYTIPFPMTLDAGTQIAMLLVSADTFQFEIAGFTNNRLYHFHAQAQVVTDTPFTTPTPTPTTPAGDLARLAPAENSLINSVASYPTRFSWAHVNSAEWYHVVVATPSFSQIFLDKWYRASDICTGETCTTADEVWVAGNGEFSWWITYWNPIIGNDYVRLYDESRFSVNLPQPGNTTATAPTGTVSGDDITVLWNRNPHAMWYQVWIGRSDYTRTVLLQWINAATSCNATVCGGQLAGDPLPSGSYEFWIQAWNPAGTSAWQQMTTFTVTP
ncbi:MAG: hypothetical protein OHK0046_09290 [Anaerolineae bacterium]